METRSQTLFYYYGQSDITMETCQHHRLHLSVVETLEISPFAVKQEAVDGKEDLGTKPEDIYHP